MFRRASHTNVPAREWEDWVQRTGGVVLDVREPAEWAQGTLPGSVRISLSDLPHRIGELDPETPVLVVCRSGNRSAVAARWMAKQGFADVSNLSGGLSVLGLA